ncbi:MAG: YkvA family protein [Bacillota bacterium]
MKDNLLPVLKRLPLYGKVAYDLYRTENLARGQKIILGAGLAYLLSPVDLVPGIIPVLGQLDDVMIALSALRKVLQSLPPETRDRCLARYGLKMGDLEKDLAVLKKIAREIARRAAGYTASGVLAAGKMAAKGALFLLRGSSRLARELLVKGGRRVKQK